MVLCTVALGLLQASSTWAFEPKEDALSPSALLDLRYLNEKVAGENGYVRRSADGADILLGDGKPARFWAVTDYVQRNPGMDALKHHARWLAKRGVNMVRFHGQISPESEKDGLESPNLKEIDQCWRLVAAMKTEGIYTTISPYWAGPVAHKYVGWGVPDNGGGEAWGLLFFDPTLQRGYRAWLKKLLATNNPYTGIPLAKDPAVALFQIQNEDSLLFWTAQNIKGAQLANLQRLYATWLAKKYGSLAAAQATWPTAKNEGDAPAQGKMGLLITWEFTQVRTGDVAKRLADQLQFLAETMRRFNAETAKYLKEELGYKGLINAGNWRTADDTKLGDAERWSYLANDVVAKNRYAGGIHTGPDQGWAIRKGDKYTDLSVLKDPRELPINLRQPTGTPTVITESEWVYPNLYQSEGPLLVAAYGALTGLDGFYWFSIGDREWSAPLAPKVGDWQPPLGKWNVNTPTQFGQFPAAALIYRQGDVRRAAPVVEERRTPDSVWRRENPLIAEEGSFDPNRDSGTQGVRAQTLTADPLSFLMGPVTVAYEKGTSAVSPNLATLHDEKKQTVQSATGELKLAYGAGIFTLDTPKAQGTVGFFGSGTVTQLRDVTITSRDPYASIVAVSMDDQPLATSKKILVQLGTTGRPTGWQAKPATVENKPGFEIENPGGNPWQLATLNAKLAIANPLLKTATVLDENGMPVAEIKPVRTAKTFEIELPKNALYVILRT